MFVFLDTPFDREFPVYMRANAGEILPDPVTPLAWSLLGSSFEEAFRISFCDDFGLLPRPGRDTPFQLTGRMAARVHLNLSAIRTTAERLPGTSAAVVDVQYFGDAGSTGLPDHPHHPDDRRYRLKAPASMGRTLAGIGRRVDRDRNLVDELVAHRSAVTAGSDADLVRIARRASAALGTVLGTHVTARGLTSPILEQATNALGRAGIEPEHALRHVAAIADLESSKPSRALGEIARTIPDGSPLADLVGGGSFEKIAHADIPGATALRDALEGFIDRFGHRGLGEFDPTIPTWRERPDDVVTLLARLRSTPVIQPEEPDVDPGRVARPLVAAARSAIARAERTKDTCMRATSLMRSVVFELYDRWGDEVTPDQLTFCTLEEVEARANGTSLPLTAELDRRAADFAKAAALEVAEWSDGSLSLIETTASVRSVADDVALDGIAGSPGVAAGRARVLADPYGDFEPGDVLVATMTDTAWTPLFLVAGAVVTDVGGVLSHATIVARDLGLPAVVNTKVATTTIRDGDRIEVDGGSGRVTILERG